MEKFFLNHEYYARKEIEAFKKCFPIIRSLKIESDHNEDFIETVVTINDKYELQVVTDLKGLNTGSTFAYSGTYCKRYDRLTSPYTT